MPSYSVAWTDRDGRPHAGVVTASVAGVPESVATQNRIRRPVHIDLTAPIRIDLTQPPKE
jgi:hypothetical protein